MNSRALHERIIVEYLLSLESTFVSDPYGLVINLTQHREFIKQHTMRAVLVSAAVFGLFAFTLAVPISCMPNIIQLLSELSLTIKAAATSPTLGGDAEVGVDVSDGFKRDELNVDVSDGFKRGEQNVDVSDGFKRDELNVDISDGFKRGEQNVDVSDGF
jgi:hypothetical protein